MRPVWIESRVTVLVAGFADAKGVSASAVKVTQPVTPASTEPMDHVTMLPLFTPPGLADTKVMIRPVVTNEAFAALQHAVLKAQQLPWRMTIPWRRGHTKSVTSVAYSPDGEHVVSGSEDQTVRMWDMETG